jgi:hypothetical protein
MSIVADENGARDTTSISFARCAAGWCRIDRTAQKPILLLSRIDKYLSLGKFIARLVK